VFWSTLPKAQMRTLLARALRKAASIVGPASSQIDITDDRVKWLCFANAGMFDRGSLPHRPRAQPTSQQCAIPQDWLVLWDSYLRNVQTFSPDDPPFTIEAFSNEFFDLWGSNAAGTDVLGRAITLGGPLIKLLLCGRQS
jgi:hypothetical protein